MSRFGVLLLVLGWAGVAGCSVVLDFDEVPLPAYEVRGGGAFTCASREPQGALWCWGDNHEGQTGTGHLGDSFWVTPPAPVKVLEAVQLFALGNAHACAVDQEGALYCWGANDNMQLGTSPINLLSEPARVGGLVRVSDVSLGDETTCAVADGGSLHCFGGNHYFELTDAVQTAQTDTPTQILISGGVDRVAAGRHHVCALAKNSAVWCWGLAYHGQVGVAAVTGPSCGEGGEFCVSTPTLVDTLDRIVVIRSGGDHTCALDDAQGLWCWGRNEFGQVGDGTQNNVFEPVQIPPVDASGWSDVAVGGGHTCAIDTDGQLWCWGRNERDQVGTGETDVNFYTQPRSVALPGFPVDLGLGENHSCAVLNSGRLYCWGENDQHQLATDHETEPLPTLVARPE